MEIINFIIISLRSNIRSFTIIIILSHESESIGLLTCKRDNMLDQREDHDTPETFPPVALQHFLPRLAEAEVHYIFSFLHNHYFPDVF